jgi:hypothetical protein
MIRGILRIVCGRSLACGCLVGVYEKYSGEVIEILDERSPSCTNAAHVRGAEVHGDPRPTAADGSSRG